MLRVDHASLRVTSLDAAIATLENSLGLSPTRSPRAPDRHSRLYFHRSYLEVSQGETPGLELYFFGFDDLEAVERHLTGSGLRFRSEPYLGVDGAWDNLEVEAPPGVPAPILVRRLQPPELAGANWPPPRAEGWSCGAREVRGFRLRVASLKTATPFFEALLQTGFTDGRGRWSGGALSLIEGAPGIDAILLGVDDLARTRAHLAQRGLPLREGAEGPEVTLSALPGLKLVFTPSW